MAKKAPKAPKADSAPDPEPGTEAAGDTDEAADEFRLDVGSFTSPERRELQKRFDTDFEDLVLYIEDKFNRLKAKEVPEGLGVEWREPPIAIVDAKGAKVFADEIVIAMIVVAKKRDDPDYDAAALEDVTNVELLEMARRPPKARTRQDSKGTKT